MAKELPIPPAALNESKSIELIRVWAAGGKQHISLATGLWPDPANWGICLVDLAKLIANAYEQTSNLNRDEALQRIKAGFDAEWNHATDRPAGKLL